MTMAVPVQEFQIGQRVRPPRDLPFIITIAENYHGSIRYSGSGQLWYSGYSLTLAPERPPYEPSERRVVGRRVTIARYQPELYRCETDDELAARHAIERAAYDAQGDGA